MAEYLPLYQPGMCIPRTTSADVTGGQLLMVSGDGTVAPATAKTAAWCGVAAYDAKSGEIVTCHCGGVQRLVAAGGITAGDILVAGAAGTVAKLAAVTTPTAADVTDTRAIVGIALTTALDTALVEVALER